MALVPVTTASKKAGRTSRGGGGAQSESTELVLRGKSAKQTDASCRRGGDRIEVGDSTRPFRGGMSGVASRDMGTFWRAVRACGQRGAHGRGAAAPPGAGAARQLLAAWVRLGLRGGYPLAHMSSIFPLSLRTQLFTRSSSNKHSIFWYKGCGRLMLYTTTWPAASRSKDLAAP